jgi:predicted Zn-ribbon and HTH transcriptional regulator
VAKNSHLPRAKDNVSESNDEQSDREKSARSSEGRQPQLPYNKRTIAILGESLSQVGLLNEILVCKQHPNVILAGRHRVKASELLQLNTREVDVNEIALKLGVPHDATEIALTIHANVQRRPKREETKALVMKQAESIEHAGNPKDRVARILSEILPFSESYLTKLLPDEYKQKDYARSPGRPRKGTKDLDFLGNQNSSDILVKVVDTKSDEADKNDSSIAEMDKPAICASCGNTSTRAKVKLVSLCEKCRRRFNIRF